MKFHIGVLIAVLALGVETPRATAQTSTIKSRANLSVASSANMERIPPRQGLSDRDQKFIEQMAQTHMAEIQFGQLAQHNGGVWSQGYGKDMVREHAMALEEVKKVAADKGLALSKDVDIATKKSFNRLNQYHGAPFDELYRNMMIAGLKQVLNLIQDEIRLGYNSDAGGD